VYSDVSSDGTNSAYYWDDDEVAPAAESKIDDDEKKEKNAAEEAEEEEENSDDEWIPDRGGEFVVRRGKRKKSFKKPSSQKRKKNNLARFPEIIVPERADIPPPKMFYRQNDDDLKLDLPLNMENKKEIEAKIEAYIESKSAASVTRALLTRHGVQPSLVGSKMGKFLSNISADFNRRAEELNPDERERDGDNIGSALSLPIFKEHKLGAFNFRHAAESAKEADVASRRTIPPPPRAPSPLPMEESITNGVDPYIRSWIKVDSFFVTWSQDEWGSLYITDLLVWVSFF
jgi:hypothetical protein